MGKPFSAQVTTAVAVKVQGNEQPLTVDGWDIMNTTAAIAYIQVFDATAANVNLGTTVADYIIPIPANGRATAMLEAGSNDMAPVAGSQRITHAKGCTIAATTTRTGNTTAACDVLMWVH